MSLAYATLENDRLTVTVIIGDGTFIKLARSANRVLDWRQDGLAAKHEGTDSS
jgi:hypothetical protein